jgi:cyclic pyranopterin phosphate synthase
MARRVPAGLTHADRSGRVRMVDVGDKPVTLREATAQGFIAVSARARRLVRAGGLRKGDPLEAARLAGIMAAKRTSELIPLCHPIALSHVAVEITPTRTGYRISATARTAARTGVEMEALTAVAGAALTIYDMLKAVDREMVIGEICLVEKTGGRTGHYRRSRGRRRTAV